MLDLRLLQLEGTVRVISKAEGVKVSARIAPLLSVKLCVPEELNTTHCKDLNPHKLADGEWKGEAKVSGTIQLHLSSINPGDAGVRLRNDAAEGGHHCPAAVDQLALTEPCESEHLRVWLQTLLRYLVNYWREASDDLASLVVVEVLVQRVDVDLQVLHRLGEAKRVEAPVSRESAIQPRRDLHVGEPKRPALKFAVADATLASPRARRSCLLGGLPGRRSGHSFP
mmetsp:Transcript_23220/g.55569  ORF Transcript_23220/g.55569 Transcript_23220/m.55569 type:complete len:226 (+) Transcript_23220:191-868(+)